MSHSMIRYSKDGKSIELKMQYLEDGINMIILYEDNNA